MGFYQKQPLFLLGELLFSPGALRLGIDLGSYLRRHQTGDWGDICTEDKDENESAIRAGEAILSQYLMEITGAEPEIVAIMTESDRSLTVVFLIGEPGDD